MLLTRCLCLVLLLLSGRAGAQETYDVESELELPGEPAVSADVMPDVPADVTVSPRPGLPEPDPRESEEQALPAGDFEIEESSPADQDEARGADWAGRDRLQIRGPRLRVMGVDVRPKFRVGAVFDDNIFLRSGQSVEGFDAAGEPVEMKDEVESDLIFQLTPGFIAGYGDYQERSEDFLLLQWAPTILRYLHHPELNTIDQDISLGGRYGFRKLTLGFELTYQQPSSAERDLSGRSSRQISGFALTSDYRVSEKTSLEVNLLHTHRDYDLFSDTTETRNQNWFNYLISPKINLAAGLTLGREQIDQTNGETIQQTYEQLLLRVVYASTAKLSFRANGGFEWRQTDSGVGDGGTPVFGLGANYAPFDSTTIALGGQRRVEPSVTEQGQNFTSTSFSVELTQRFFQKIYLGVKTSYEKAQYEPVNRQIDRQGRDDDYIVIQTSLRYSPQEWLTLSMFHLYRRNTSSEPLRNFDNNQFGVECALAF